MSASPSHSFHKNAFARHPAASATPPAPHDPSERALVLELAGWEVRLFTDARFRYFVPRGLWHVQLWHPRALVSVLTRSGLTRGAYEVFPIAEWKGRATDHAQLQRMVEREHQVSFLTKAELLWVEKRFVKDIVRGAARPKS